MRNVCASKTLGSNFILNSLDKDDFVAILVVLSI